MKRFTPVFLAIVFVMTSASIATAQEKCEGHGEAMVSPVDPEVKAAVRKLDLQYRLDTVDLKAEQMKLHAQMTEELKKDEPSAKALDKIHQDMSAVRAKMHKITVAHLLAVKKVLPKDHWAAYLKKHHGGGCCGMACGCAHDGVKKGGCVHGASRAMGGHCSHGGAIKAPAKSAGCAGAAGCSKPCVRIRK